MILGSLLNDAGYQLNSDSNVWSKPDYQGIAYNDGDAIEQRVGEAIRLATDLSVLSPELRKECTDWPSLYHLGSSRANILRPFGAELLGADVLEIGAGCGAITRYLGESKARVLALEGTLRRAAIARSRTRDLDNVVVVAESFSAFSPDSKFDFITLIGVLEYANMFMLGDTPALAMLERCRDMLKPEGRLIIAIENQFGLKYFAGAPEDHMGSRMYGIENRYKENEPHTFGRKVLRQLVLDGGFQSVEVMAPFPDYKFPYSIVTQAGFESQDFDASAFAWQAARRDPQWNGYMNLAMELTWPGVFENQMAQDLANSFLLVCQLSVDHRNQAALAYHYSTERVPVYCKETRFVRDSQGNIKVQCEQLVDQQPDRCDDRVIYGLDPEIDYTLGTPLSMDFIGIVTKEGWKLGEVVAFFRNYTAILESICEQQGITPERHDKTGEMLFPGSFFDLLPQNIIQTSAGVCKVIDTEWKTKDSVSLSTLVFRSILNLTQMVTRFARCGDLDGMTRQEFYSRIFFKLRLDPSTHGLYKLLESEIELQEMITGRSFKELIEWWPGAVLNTHDLLSEREERLAGLMQLSQLQQDVILDRDQHIELLKSSLSWRVTKPLRDMKRYKGVVANKANILGDEFRRRGGVLKTLIKAMKKIRAGGLMAARQSLKKPFSSEHRTNDFDAWVRRYDMIDDALRIKIKSELNRIDKRPLVSIVMPVYNPDPQWLSETIESVSKQIYSNWELCIADDASTNPEIRQVLEHFKLQDTRIRVVYRESNGHISHASNSALDMAEGEWIALLDHDDVLAEHALALIVQAINESPEAGLIYSDEDKLDQTGRRVDPYFKPEFDPLLLRGQNMICHLAAFRHDLVKSAGGFRTGFEGAQDYDLVLRVTEKLEPEQVIHIPHILYHWRIHVSSTAASPDAKGYAYKAGLNALQEHLNRTDSKASAEVMPYSYYRVRYQLPSPEPRVSIIIPTRNGYKLMRQCIESIQNKSTYPNYEIIVVDNGSDDITALKYFESLQKDALIRVIRDDRPFNYSMLNNSAVAQAKGEYVCLMNNDIEVISSDWLEEMMGLAVRPGVGVVGACLWYPDNTLQHGGVVLGIGGVAGHSQKHMQRKTEGYFGRGVLTQTYSAVTAACCVVRKSIYEEVGGLNEADLQVAFNDVDFCLKVRQAGYRNVWTPYAELYHHESASRGYEDTPEKQARFTREEQYMMNHWGYLLRDDPAYNPNLTLDHEDFTLAWPPRVKY